MQIRKFLIITVAIAGLGGCSQETRNKISRIGVTWFEGNYHVTFAEGQHLKQWTVHGAKITSEPGKGYYYFWAEENGKKFYVQTPIERTYIEEIP